jgi:hypothetical protein
MSNEKTMIDIVAKVVSDQYAAQEAVWHSRLERIEKSLLWALEIKVQPPPPEGGYVDTFSLITHEIGNLKATARRANDGRMSLRDWFAGQAVAGLMTEELRNDYCPDRFAYMADTAYRLADAMHAARTKGSAS